MKSGTAPARARRSLTGKADRSSGVAAVTTATPVTKCPRTSLKRATSMELTNSRLSRASRASSGSRWLHVATQAHELASLLDETVSNQSGDQRRARRTSTSSTHARRCRTEWGRSRNAARTRPELAIRTLEFRLGLDTPALRGAGSGPPPRATAHTAIGQGSQRGVEVQNCAPRSSRAWLNAAAFDRGKSSLATTRASRTLSVRLRRRARALDQRWYPRRRHTREGEGGHGVRRVLTDPGQSSQVRDRVGTAPSNSSRIIIAASWSAFARR